MQEARLRDAQDRNEMAQAAAAKYTHDFEEQSKMHVGCSVSIFLAWDDFNATLSFGVMNPANIPRQPPVLASENKTDQ